jgi:zinc protease
MLAEGAGGQSADLVAEGFASLGARFGNASYRDMAVVELRSLSTRGRLEPAVELLASVIGKPDFPARALERVRGQLLVSLDLVRQSPSEIASQAFYRRLYGEHPYAHPTIGDEDSVNAITAADAVRFHARYYVAGNAVIAIVGDVARARAEALAETLTAGLGRGAPAPALPPVPETAAGADEIIAYPSAQSHVYAGLPVMDRLDPDFYALYLGNHILGGGGLVSRLADEVREERGLSYSISSSFSPMRVAGPFTINLQTRNERAREALRVVRETLERFIADGPTQREMDDAKANITGGFPLRIDSNAKIAQYLSVIGFYGLPLDYLDRFNARIEAVTRTQILDAFRRRVPVDRLQVIMVGQVPPRETPGSVQAAAAGS